MYLLQTVRPRKGQYKEFTYREVLLVVNGRVQVRFKTTRDALVNSGGYREVTPRKTARHPR